MPGKFNFLSRFLPHNSPALINAEDRALMTAEQRAALEASEGALPEVIGQGTSKAIPEELPIIEADTLSPKLNDVDLPLNPEQTRLEKLKAGLAAIGVGGIGGAAIASQMGGSSDLPPPLAPSKPIDIAPQARIAPKIEPVETPTPPNETERVIQAMMAKLSRPSSAEAAPAPIKNIDFGDNTTASREGLNQAYKNRDAIQIINELGKAADITGSAMSGVKPGFGAVFDQNIKDAGNYPKDYQDKIKFEKEDPNSSISKGYKEIAKSMGFNITGKASASDLEKLIPQLANIYNQGEAQKARSQSAKENREARMQELQLRFAMTKDAKDETALEKDRQKLGDLTNFSKQARGNAAQIENLVNQGERLQTLIDSVPKNPRGEPDLSQVTPLQKEELIRTFDTLLAGKSTVSGQKELMQSADSIYNKIAKLRQLVTGNKAYGHEGGLLKSIVDTVNREKGLAIEKIKDMSYQNSTGFKRLNEKDPKFVKDILREKGQIDDIDYELRQLGYRANDLNRLYNSGYNKEEILDLARNKTKPSEIKAKPVASAHSKSSQPAPIKQASTIKSIRPEDVDNLSDEEVEAELERRGL